MIVRTVNRLDILECVDAESLERSGDLTDVFATARFGLALRDDILATLFVTDDGVEYEHNDGCEGEPTCPACWVSDIRAIVANAESRFS